MKKFMLLHMGFEQPTPEIMAAWQKWFVSIADTQIDQGGFSRGREISKDGVQELAWGSEAITGYNIIEAEDMDAAAKIAAECPFISSIRLYELRNV